MHLHPASLYQMDFTFWHKVMLSLLFPALNSCLGLCLHVLIKKKKSFNRAKSNYLEAKAPEYHLILYL